LHVKGYSRARVTHVDVECGELNEAVPPGAHAYATAYTRGGELRVRFREPLKAFGYARELVIMCPELAAVLAPMRDTVYVGGKEGGIFIGFRREQIRKLETLASSLGVAPR
jgi:fructose-1,6-bisphosphatase/inositol monophosphatase family enzyme